MVERPVSTRRHWKKLALALLFLLAGVAAISWMDFRRPLVVVASGATNQVLAIEARTGEVLARVPVPGEPQGIAMAPQGDLCYVAGRKSDEVSIIDTATWQVTGTFPVLPEPCSLDISRDGSVLFASHMGLQENRGYAVRTVMHPHRGPRPQHKVKRHTVPFSNVKNSQSAGFPMPRSRDWYFAFDTDIPEVLVTDRKTRAVRSSIPVGLRPIAMGWNLDLSRAYVVVQGEEAVKVLDASEQKVVKSIPVGRHPNHFKTIEGSHLGALVSHADENVLILDMKNDEVLHTVAVGGVPDWIDVWPNDPERGR